MWAAMLGDTELAPSHFPCSPLGWIGWGGARVTFINALRLLLTHDSCEAADCWMRKEPEVTFEKQQAY